ncbi:24395_t:CDS:2 [Cetraspora pellucida]|uniref:24395_t:CDS:1 n=1 Tax=Cetraspora pellucida TaxID=1433469 RepID=A0A9N9GQ49_9GLOM|nr:24395_t:CDS:2 [Cetraspora pellucida]
MISIYSPLIIDAYIINKNYLRLKKMAHPIIYFDSIKLIFF